MKTTLVIPDHYHKQLKKLAIDRSQSLATLVTEAIRNTFFPQVLSEQPSSRMEDVVKYPVLALKGSLKLRTPERKIAELKKIWNHKKPLP